MCHLTGVSGLHSVFHRFPFRQQYGVIGLLSCHRPNCLALVSSFAGSCRARTPDLRWLALVVVTIPPCLPCLPCRSVLGHDLHQGSCHRGVAADCTHTLPRTRPYRSDLVDSTRTSLPAAMDARWSRYVVPNGCLLSGASMPVRRALCWTLPSPGP